MIRAIRFAAAATAMGLAAGFALPASAQYKNEFVPAKLVRQGTSSQPIGGKGVVVVQVQVNANGTHRVVKIIRSTNHADDAAAREIAQTSTYRPAHRGSTPINAFYDFTLKFNGKSASSLSNVASGSAAARVDRLIHQGKYNEAKSQLQDALSQNASDPILNQELGVTDYFLADYAGAAAAFDKVPSISNTFKQVAAQSYAMAAVKTAQSAPQQAVAYAKRAAALSPNGNSYYALGSAELGAGDATAAVADLKKAYADVSADPKAQVRSKVNVAEELYEAYTKAGDAAAAQQTLAQIKAMDPNNATIGTLEGNQYLEAGIAASKAGNHDEALKDLLQAASVGSQQVQVTAYTQAAFEESNIIGAQKTPPTADDYGKVKAYADKALAINPNDPSANFAEGVGVAGEYIVGGKKDPSLKAQALAALDKARSEAQSSGNTALISSIDGFIAKNLQ